MLITVAIFLMFLGGVVWWIQRVKFTKGSWESDFGGRMTTIIIGIVLIVILVLLIVNPILVKVRILQFNSVQMTLNEARNNPGISAFELAAIQQKAIEENKWLAKANFWTMHLLTNWFWTKKVFELHPIK